LEQVQEVPKKSTEYSEDERAKFPRLFRFRKNHVLDWHENHEPVEWYSKFDEPKPEKVVQ